MRYALVPFGSRGDVHPMLALGRRLRADGHEVILGASAGFAGDARAAGLEFAPVAGDAQTYIQAHAQDYTSSVVRSARALHRHLCDELDAQFRDLPGALAGCDVVVAAGMQLAAASVAEAMGIAYRYVAYCPALLQSREHAPLLLPLGATPRWLNPHVWGLVRFVYGRTLRPRIDAHRRRLGLRPVADLYHHVLGGRPLLATDPELARVPGDSDPVPVQTGYWFGDDARPAALPAEVERFLDAGPPPVFVGFGSMACPDPERTTCSLVEAMRHLGRRAVIQRGWGQLARQPLPAGMLAVGDVAHAALFPRMAAVVHHGGAGTTAAAARSGRPQLVVPHIADQFYWGQRVATVGVGGPPLPRTRLTAARLAEALDPLLRDPGTRERAWAIGKALRRREGAAVAAQALA